jgi:hypothetical protein
LLYCAAAVLIVFTRRQVLDMYFGNVCELDLIFNFHKAYYILDELLIAGGHCSTNSIWQPQQQRQARGDIK